MIAVETNKSSKDIVNKCLGKGLLVNPVTETALRFLPPLIISKKEIDEAINILDSVFSQNI
jgi:acetylornithine/succinyldiaminopimelate/putrescine aminotransferase